MSLIAELKRRNVFKVAIAYLLLAWLIMQLGDVLAPALHLPDWVPSLLAFFLILGFPLALFFSWAFELTDEGVKLEKNVAEGASRAAQTGRVLNFAIIGLLFTAAAYFFWESRIADRGPVASTDSVSVANPDGTPSGTLPSESTVSIAVLPFVNVSQDPGREYFSDGITEEIINSLVKVPGLTVPARTTVFAFKGQQRDIRDIGQSLGVAHVLEGTVRSIDDDAVITASLIQVSDGSRRWTERFQRRLENIFALQEELAAAIAAELQLELIGVNAVPNRTSDVSAFDSYLQGRAALRKRDDSAIVFLEQATRADPAFAPAWASLAIAYQSDARKQQSAIDAARRAIAIDPDNVDALTALASVYRQSRQWQESERNFQQALAIDPGSAELLEDYTEFLNLVGDRTRALSMSATAMEIDPRIQPLVAAYAEALHSNGETIKAREVAESSMQSYGETQGVWLALLPLWLTPVDGKLLPLPASNAQHAEARYIKQFLETPNAESEDALQNALLPGATEYAEIPVSRRTARLLLLHLGKVDYVIDQDIANPSVFPSSLREWLWTPYFDAYRRHARFPEFLSHIGLIEYWQTSGLPDLCQQSPTGVIQCE